MSLIKKTICLFVMAIALFIGIKDVNAKIEYKGERVDYKETSSYREYTFDLYALITGDSVFNHTDGKLLVENRKITSFLPMLPADSNVEVDFNSETLEYSITSNKTYTAKDGKVVFARVKMRSIDYEKECDFDFQPNAYKLAVTNTFTIDKYAYKDGKKITNIKAGESFQYKIKIKSAKNELDTDSVVVTDIIPDELELTNASVNSIINGQKVTWTLGTFAKNAEKEVELTAWVKAKKDIKGKISNTATLTAGDKELKDTADVEALFSSIAIEKKVSKSQIAKGEKFYYTIRIKNNGTGVSNDIRVEDTLDDDLELINSSIANDGYGNYLIFNIGKLEAGTSKTIKAEVKLKDATTKDKISNTAIAKEEEKNPIEATTDIKVVEEVVIPDLSISKKVNVSEAKKGDYITYEIVVKNIGTASVGDVTIEDNLSEYLTTNPLIADDDWEVDGNKIIIHISSIAPGEELKYNIAARILENANTDTIKNIATLKYGNTTKNSEEVTVKVLAPDSSEETDPSNPNNPTTPTQPEPLPENPNTGIIAGISITALGILSIISVYFYKKKNKFYKI